MYLDLWISYYVFMKIRVYCLQQVQSKLTYPSVWNFFLEWSITWFVNEGGGGGVEGTLETDEAIIQFPGIRKLLQEYFVVWLGIWYCRHSLKLDILFKVQPATVLLWSFRWASLVLIHASFIDLRLNTCSYACIVCLYIKHEKLFIYVSWWQMVNVVHAIFIKAWRCFSFSFVWECV